MIKPGMQGCQLLGKSNVINKKEDVDEGHPMPQTILHWVLLNWVYHGISLFI